MEIAMAKNIQATVGTSADVVFRCQQCKAELVLSPEETRLSMKCVQCGKLTAVPRWTKRVEVVDPAALMAEIQRKFTENESQRTEVTGYINQASIQLHRWQLRLQQLNERKEQLEKELAGLKT
jgi:DNA-directed RNA polymerase subunit RPC12/RpoP